MDVSNPERTLVDVLDDPGLGGGMRHVADCLAARFDEGLDQERLIDYVHRLGNGAVFKRLGFLVETLQLDVPQLVAECQERQSTGISALDPTVDRKGRILSRWNLRVNVDVSGGNDARSVPGHGSPAD